jgi:N-acylglucosamine-6-phosphate 2-epimerase
MKEKERRLVMNKSGVIVSLEHGLIVSCQAEEHEPLGKPEILAALAQAAVTGGAVGIRACCPQNILAIQASVRVPIIGITKKVYPDSEVFITPTLLDALDIAETCPEIIALDATRRHRPRGESLENIFSILRRRTASLIMADISDFEEGMQAAEMGFDLIGTTLSGYTDYSLSSDGQYEPDLKLIYLLARELGQTVPVIAEGRYWQPEDAVKALNQGAWAVVVGSAITRPQLITRRYVDKIQASYLQKNTVQAANNLQ